MTSLDCLVFAAGCVEDPNPAKSSKSPKAEVTHWEELAFCGYKRDISDRKFFSKRSYTCGTQTSAKHVKNYFLQRKSPPCYFRHFHPLCQLANFRLDEFQCLILHVSLLKYSRVWANSRLRNIVCK